jgi:hypothetical protein
MLYELKLAFLELQHKAACAFAEAIGGRVARKAQLKNEVLLPSLVESGPRTVYAVTWRSGRVIVEYEKWRHTRRIGGSASVLSVADCVSVHKNNGDQGCPSESNPVRDDGYRVSTYGMLTPVPGSDMRRDYGDLFTFKED